MDPRFGVEHSRDVGNGHSSSLRPADPVHLLPVPRKHVAVAPGFWFELLWRVLREPETLCRGNRGPHQNLSEEGLCHARLHNGVPEKVMISWEPLLSPLQMKDVSSYILSIVGTDPPNAKAPEGTELTE